jgi:hypothetical protein
MSVVLNGNDLMFSQLYDVALRGETVSLAPAAIERMNASRAVVERLVASGRRRTGLTQDSNLLQCAFRRASAATASESGALACVRWAQR